MSLTSNVFCFKLNFVVHCLTLSEYSTPKARVLLSKNLQLNVNLTMSRNKNPLYTTNTLDDGFSVTVASLLLGMGAELYIPLFKKYNFGKKDLEKLTNEDLIIMGIDNSELREHILKLFGKKKKTELLLEFTAENRSTIIKESTKLMELTKLSLNSCKKNVLYAKNSEDILVAPNLYASDLMLEAIDEIEFKLKGIRKAITSEKKVPQNKQKMLTLAVVGSTAFVIFGICLFKYQNVKMSI